MFCHLLHSWPVARALLKTASLLVPRAGRPEWLREWRSELWHVGCSLSVNGARAVHGEPEITAFCAGAFKDAYTLRQHAIRQRAAIWLALGSPSRCLLFLTSILLVSIALACAVPQVRHVLWGSGTGSTDHLVLVSHEGSFDESAPSIRFDEYLAWKNTGHAFAKRLIFYRVVQQRVATQHARGAEFRIAYASNGLLQVLTPTLTRIAPANRGDEAEALVSQHVWRKFFRDSTQPTLVIAGKSVPVVAAAQGATWPIPGAMDIILLESDRALHASSRRSVGFMLAPGIEKAVSHDDPRHPYILAYRDSGPAERYECATLSQRRTPPYMFFLFTLLLACIALPATTPLPLGDFPADQHAPRAIPRMRRWVFLACKMLLAVAPVYPLSLAAVYSVLPAGSPHAELSQLALSFGALLFTLRWVLRDQRKRCPNCLRLLASPAHVGHPSRSFLAWHGTEMLCPGGHGLLYIPEHPTSWCSTQRWQSLDTSWAGLFTA